MSRPARGVYRWRHMAPFWHQLAVLLRSGLALHQAIPLAGSGSAPAVARWSQSLGQDCGEGLSLEEALRRHQTPTWAAALIAAGEHCGRLAETCDHLATLYHDLLINRRQLINRLLYPLLVLHAALVLPAVPMVVLENRLWPMALGPLILWAGVAILVATWRLIVHRWAAGLVLLPPLSLVGRPYISGRICRVLAIAAEAGMLHDRALSLAASACGNRIITAKLENAAQAMTGGHQPSITTALGQITIIDDSSLALINSGEQAGALPDALRRAANLEEEQLRQRISWAIRIIAALVMTAALIVALIQVVSFWLDHIAQIEALL